MSSGILGSVLLLSAASCAALAVGSDETRAGTFIVHTGHREKSSEDSAGLPSDNVEDPWTTTTPRHKNIHKHRGCEDAPPEKTGFEVHTDEGRLGFASCQDLTSKCHNWANASYVQDACPVSCFLCDPSAAGKHNEPPCYDSIITGVRFKNGPKAVCSDLAMYCNHTSLYYHVQAACRLTCGLCDAHIGHVAGQCADLESHDQPEFMVAGQVASCSDLGAFCGGGYANSNLIKHKCPRTCGVCEDLTTSVMPPRKDYEEGSANEGQSDCDRRRRYGFCTTRRRRNM